jgi:hypothetical protein
MQNAHCKMQTASRVVAAVALLLFTAAPVFAQDTQPKQKPTPPQPAASNPIVVQRVSDQFFLGPEYKLTDMNGHTGQLVGATGGILMQEVFLIGGSVYHLVNGPTDWELTYGGFVFGIQSQPERAIRFGARSLIGFGTGSNNATYAYPVYPPFPVPHGGMYDSHHYPGYPGYPTNGRVHYEENFFVFEPQGDLLFAISNKIRFGVSGGYRWTDSSDYFQRAFNGVTGTFALQVGF